jgi:hypothetical protein
MTRGKKKKYGRKSKDPETAVPASKGTNTTVAKGGCKFP